MRAVGGRCVMGNADRQMVEDFDAGRGPADATTRCMRTMLWAVRRSTAPTATSSPASSPRCRSTSTGSGRRCSATARRAATWRCITRATPHERLAPMLEGVEEPIVVCGHTHQQFDLRSVSIAWSTPAASGCRTRAPPRRSGCCSARGSSCAAPATTSRRRWRRCADRACRTSTELLLRESLIDPVDPDEVTQFFETGCRVDPNSPVLRSGVRSSGSASSISLVKMRSPRL